jgi:hypothetical protein
MNVKEYCKSIYCKIIRGGGVAYKTDGLLYVGRQTRTSNKDKASANTCGKRFNDRILIDFPGEVPLVFNHGKNRFSESGQPPPFEGFSSKLVDIDKIKTSHYKQSLLLYIT